MLLNVGAGGLVTTFRPILAALNYKFQIGADGYRPLLWTCCSKQQNAAEFQILLELQLQLY